MTVLKTCRAFRAGPLSAIAALSILLSACGPQDGTPAAQTAAAQAVKVTSKAVNAKPPVVRGELGTVTAVTALRSPASSTGAGAVLGGVVGAALGNQVGKGDGRKAATVLGAVGGALAGNQIEKDRTSTITGYRVDVALDNGTRTSMRLDSASGIDTGQRVRLVDGALHPV